MITNSIGSNYGASSYVYSQRAQQALSFKSHKTASHSFAQSKIDELTNNLLIGETLSSADDASRELFLKNFCTRFNIVGEEIEAAREALVNSISEAKAQRIETLLSEFKKARPGLLKIDDDKKISDQVASYMKLDANKEKFKGVDGTTFENAVRAWIVHARIENNSHQGKIDNDYLSDKNRVI